MDYLKVTVPIFDIWIPVYESPHPSNLNITNLSKLNYVLHSTCKQHCVLMPAVLWPEYMHALQCIIFRDLSYFKSLPTCQVERSILLFTSSCMNYCLLLGLNLLGFPRLFWMLLIQWKKSPNAIIFLFSFLYSNLEFNFCTVAFVVVLYMLRWYCIVHLNKFQTLLCGCVQSIVIQ